MGLSFSELSANLLSPHLCLSYVSPFIQAGLSQGVQDLDFVVQDLGIAPSTVSHHIKELCQADLIDMERQGQNIQCRIDPEVTGDLAVFFTELNDLLTSPTRIEK